MKNKAVVMYCAGSLQGNLSPWVLAKNKCNAVFA